MSKTLSAIQLGVMALFSPLAMAFSPFVVKDIRVEGVQRTEAGTVFNYLPIRIGDTVAQENVSEAIKALYATGFYRDVRIEVDKDVLVVVVDERPAIAQISFTGNKKFSSEDLLKGLRSAGISESRTFDRAMLEQAEQEIKRLYLTSAYYGASVKATVSPLERNRVAITFEITEGDVARIRSIRILGAKTFKESTLVGLMNLEVAGGLLPWFRNDKYSKQQLQADIEEIRSWYLDRGYLNFAVESTQVSVSPDKQDIHISLSISEGEQYRLGAIKLAGELLLPESELRPLVKLKSGEIYSRARIGEVTRALTDRFGNEGYAFANVNATPETSEKTREVALTLFVDPGRQAYVNRIRVVGNSRTRDEVVRREFLQFESAWFDRASVDRSKERVARTGFFDDVTIDTVPVTGAADQVDLNVNVKERATGSLTLGVGYSATDKLALLASVSQNNLFGTGNALSLSVNTGKVNRTIAVSYDTPYWTVDGVSRGIDVYQRRTDTRSTSVAGYKSDAIGTGVRFGVPIGMDERINFGVSADITRIDVYEDSPVQYIDFVDRFGNRNTTVMTSLGWSSDKRDSATYPTRGSSQSVSGEVAVPLGDMQYTKVGYQWQRYFPISTTNTVMLSFDAAAVAGYGGKPVPFYKNLYAGGIGSIRGFENYSLGAKVRNSSGELTGDTLGGTRRILGSIEYFFPAPVGKEKDRSMRFSTFVDVGSLWGAGETLKDAGLRVSTGFGLSWLSPIGPMRFALGFPIRKKSGDEVQRFQFTIGTTM
ncbi:MAG: outer membrane protein assembly factor BamA [Candidatus Dactylopiibacterium carminicum]|nr:MAG: outer membrane protein assembly factor BamA [Candidatus Dactylopiibacterium carminicum]